MALPSASGSRGAGDWIRFGAAYGALAFSLADMGSQIRSVTGDIRNLEKLKAVFAETEPEIVLHLAAQPIVRESYKSPVYTYETNVMGTVNVLECVRLTDSVKSF